MEDLLDREESFALVTVVKGPPTGKKMIVFPEQKPEKGFEGSLGNSDLDRVVSRDARGELAAGRSGVRNYGESGEAREETVQVFVESFIQPPKLLIVGAVDFTAALVKIGKVLGYRITVCDAREIFATKQRFPLADEVVAEWPNKLIQRLANELGPRDAVCILTHDAKFDVPAIVSSLETDVGYIGVMGSRKTHEDRLKRLHEAGIDKKELVRLYPADKIVVASFSQSQGIQHVVRGHCGDQIARVVLYFRPNSACITGYPLRNFVVGLET